MLDIPRLVRTRYYKTGSNLPLEDSGVKAHQEAPLMERDLVFLRVRRNKYSQTAAFGRGKGVEDLSFSMHRLRNINS